MDFKSKYLKYKSKYLIIKKFIGGENSEIKLLEDYIPDSNQYPSLLDSKMMKLYNKYTPLEETHMNLSLVDKMIQLSNQYPDDNCYKIFSKLFGRESLKELIIDLDYPEGMNEYDYPVKKIREYLLNNLIDDNFVELPVIDKNCKSLYFCKSMDDIYFLMNEFLLYFRFGYLTDYICDVYDNKIFGGADAGQIKPIDKIKNDLKKEILNYKKEDEKSLKRLFYSKIKEQDEIFGMDLPADGEINLSEEKKKDLDTLCDIIGSTVFELDETYIEELVIYLNKYNDTSSVIIYHIFMFVLFVLYKEKIDDINIYFLINEFIGVIRNSLENINIKENKEKYLIELLKIEKYIKGSSNQTLMKIDSNFPNIKKDNPKVSFKLEVLPPEMKKL